MNLRGVWERVGIRPWTLDMLLVGFAILLVAVEFARVVLPTCDEQEKAALAEFPQYGGKVAGKDLDIYGDELNWPPLQAPPPGCALQEFGTPQASPEQVLGYYDKKLTENGWTVKRSPVDRGGDFFELEGTRDGLRYVVYSFKGPGSGATAIRV